MTASQSMVTVARTVALNDNDGETYSSAGTSRFRSDT